MISVPLSFTSLHAAGSELIMLLIVAGPNARASISLGMYSVWGRLYVMGLVASETVGCRGLRIVVTLGSPRISLVVSVLVRLKAGASRAVLVFFALSSGDGCLGVLLI